MAESLAHQLKNETWIWYAAGFVTLLSRYWSQWLRKKSWKGFRIDDVLMFFCFCTYTTMIICVNKWSQINPIITDRKSEEAFRTTRHMATLSLVIESTEVTTLYSVKACFLILYYRLTSQLFQQKAVIVTAVISALLYIATIATLYGGFCRPFHDYFVPEPANIQCVTWFKYSIFELTLNGTSDLLIIAIPISVVWNSRMSLLKKIGLCTVFGLGIFVILAACLTKYFVFTNPIGTKWPVWYIREGSMAIIVANIVLLHPLLSCFLHKAVRLFTPLSSFVSTRRTSSKVSFVRSEGTVVDSEAQNSRSAITIKHDECPGLEKEVV